MKVEVLFECPSWLAEGLRTGEFVRTGGVIQRAAGQKTGGEMIAWLREVPRAGVAGRQAAPSPSASQSLLGWFGSVASIVNLGATMAIWQTLEEQNRKLDDLKAGQENIRRELQQGFNAIQNGLEKLTALLRDDKNSELLGRLEAVRRKQNRALTGSGDAADRRSRLQRAQEEATTLVCEQLARADSRVSGAVGALAGTAGTARIAQADSILDALMELRLAAGMAAVEAHALALNGEMDSARQAAMENSEHLEGLLRQVVRGLLGKDSHDETLALLLLDPRYEALDGDRFERWVRRFEPVGIRDISSAINYLRQHQTTVARESSSTPAHPHRAAATISFTSSKRWVPPPCFFRTTDAPVRDDDERLGRVAGAVDAVAEDIDRLRGMSEEYGYCEREGITLGEFASRLVLPEHVPDDADVAVFVRRREQSR